MALPVTQDALKDIEDLRKLATRNAITPPADSFLVKLGTSMLPEEPASLIQSPETVARAADERRQSQAVAAREIELETPHPLPPGIQPVTVKEPGMGIGRTPGFQLPGPSVDEPGAEPRRVYGWSPEAARKLGRIAEIKGPFSEIQGEEVERKAAWRKAANERRLVNLSEIREEMTGIRPSEVETGVSGEKEPIDWRPSFPEKVRRGVVAVGEGTLAAAVALGKAAPGIVLRDPVTQRAIAETAIDTAEQLGEFGKVLAADPVGVLSKMWEEDPVMVGQILAIPLSGGGSILTALERLSTRIPKLAGVLKTVGKVGRVMKAAGGQAAAAPVKLGLTATGLPLPGSYVYDASKFIAGSDIMPPSLRSAARRVVLKPTAAIETLSPELRALARTQTMPGVEDRIAAEAALSKLYGMAEDTVHPISGEVTKTRDLFTEIVHAQPEHWRKQVALEGRSTQWVDPKTQARYGGKVALPDDEVTLARLKMVDEPEGLDGSEFMRKKLLARQFAGDKELPPTLEEYGVTVQWRDAAGKVYKPKDLPPDAAKLKGLTVEYVPVDSGRAPPQEAPWRLSFQEKQEQTGVPIRPAPERTGPPELGEPVAAINQREIEFPLPEKGPAPKPGQTIGGLPTPVREGVDFSAGAPWSRPVDWEKLPPDIVGAERVDFPIMPPPGFSTAAKTAERVAGKPLPKPTIAAPQIVYEVLKNQSAAPLRAFDVTADQFVARFQGRPEIQNMHPYNRAVALREAHREIVTKLREKGHPIAPGVLAEYPDVAATGESDIQLAREFTPPPEKATGELRMGPVEVTPPPPEPRLFEATEQRGPPSVLRRPRPKVGPPTAPLPEQESRFAVGAPPEGPRPLPPSGPTGVLGKRDAPEVPFLRPGEAYPGPPRGLPDGAAVQGELPLIPPPRGGLPTPFKPITLAPEGQPPLVVSEGPGGRMVAAKPTEPPKMRTPKLPKMSDENRSLVRDIVQPVRQVIDNLGARAAELGIIEGEDLIKRFGSYLSRRYDWDALLKKNPELALKMKVVQEALGTDSAVEAAAARYGEFLRFKSDGQDMAARRIIGDLPMQTLKEAYELMADGPNVVRDTTFRLANAVSRGEFMKGVSELPGAVTSEAKLPSGWKRVPVTKLASGRPSYGPLAGKAVSPEVWDALQLLEDLNEGATRSVGWLAKGEAGVKAWKQVHVLWPYNVGALPRNFINATFNQAVMGNLAPWHVDNAKVYARVAGQLRKGGADLDEWRAASAASGGRSLLDDSRMRSAVMDAVGGMTWEKARAALRNGVKQDVDWLKLAKKWGLDKPAELYAASDEYFKAVAYTIVREMQRAFEGGGAGAKQALKRAAGFWGDDAQAMLAGGPRAALRHAYESFLDYSDVPGWVSAVSRYGVAPFYKFTALTAEQITNYFRRRPLHSLALRALGDVSERFLSYASGYTPEQVEEAERVSPAYRGSQVFVGRDSTGKPMFVQSQYMVSAGSLWSPQREGGEGGATQALSEMVYGGPVAQTFMLGTSLGPAPSADWFTGKPFVPASAPGEIKRERAAERAGQLLMPPAISWTAPAIAAAWRGESAPHQTTVQSVPAAIAGALSGTKLASVDVPRRKAVLAADLKRRLAELTGEITRLTMAGDADSIGQIPAMMRQKQSLQFEYIERIRGEK